MKIETLKHYLQPKNWKLTVDQFEQLLEISGDCVEHDIPFNRKNAIKGTVMEADLNLKELDWKDVKDEIFVRAVLNGEAEQAFWGTI